MRVQGHDPGSVRQRYCVVRNTKDPRLGGTMPSFGARLVCWLLLTLVTAMVAQADPPKGVLMLRSFGPEFGDLYARDMRAQLSRQLPGRLEAGYLSTPFADHPVLFREPTAWERYRWQTLIIAAVLVLEAALIVRLLHDRRRRRRAEIDAHQRMAELAELNRRSTVGELSASIAHELTQSLSAISHNAEAAALILRATSPDLSELRDIVAGITRDQRCATEAIKRLRNQLSKTPSETQEIDLNEAVREVFEFLSATAAARHINLSTSLAAQALRVSGDRMQLQQVILNLVINGIAAIVGSENGERKIIGRTALVDAASAEITIEDSGPGIPPDKAEQIFEPFFTTKAGGMGMGLSIARTIVESHRGRIWAENRCGGGAMFRFRVPLTTKELKGMPAHTGASQEESVGRESA